VFVNTLARHDLRTAVHRAKISTWQTTAWLRCSWGLW
jgi:hypothetical protein